MRVYFAGPLFTPYVREYISAKAQILREHGMDVFVPHESFRPHVGPEGRRLVAERGLLSEEQANSATAQTLIHSLLQAGRITREELGLPALSPDHIFDVDACALRAANAVLAVLDGTQVDDGTACEIGIFYGLSRSDRSKRGILGLVTDSRSLRKAQSNWGLNYFLLGTLEENGMVCPDFDMALDQLLRWKSELDEWSSRGR